MGNNPALEEKILRFAAPALYQHGRDIFKLSYPSLCDPWDSQKNETGFDVILRFSQSFSQSIMKKGIVLKFC